MGEFVKWIKIEGWGAVMFCRMPDGRVGHGFYAYGPDYRAAMERNAASQRDMQEVGG